MTLPVPVFVEGHKVHPFPSIRKGRKPAAVQEDHAKVSRKPASEVIDMPIERDHMGRKVYAWVAVHLLLSAFFDPNSMPYFLEHSHGGSIAVGAIAIAALLLVADVIINDMAPPSVYFNWAYRRRTLVYIVSSFLFMVPLFAATRAEARTITVSDVFLYAGMAGLGVFMATRSAVQRHRHRAARGRVCES